MTLQDIDDTVEYIYTDTSSVRQRKAILLTKENVMNGSASDILYKHFMLLKTAYADTGPVSMGGSGEMELTVYKNHNTGSPDRISFRFRPGQYVDVETWERFSSKAFLEEDMPEKGL